MTEDHRIIKSAKSARDGNVSEASIPDAVWLAAIEALDGHGELRIIEVISRAILAEREACAKIAECLVREAGNDEEAGSSDWLCRVNVNSVSNHIAEAIRRR